MLNREIYCVILFPVLKRSRLVGPLRLVYSQIVCLAFGIIPFLVQHRAFRRMVKCYG
jgi:hypothetical protein